MQIPVRSKEVIISSFVGKPSEKKLTKIYNEAYKQITYLWKMLPESANTSSKSDLVENMEINGVAGSKNEIVSMQEKLDSLKGKQLCFKEKMTKKKLKYKLRKEKKSQEIRLLKQESAQKKKKLKEQKWAEKMKHGGQNKTPEEVRISETANDNSSDEDDESEEEEEEIRPTCMINFVKQPKLKEKPKNKTSIEEITQEDQDEDETPVKKQPEGISKKQLKRLAKQELKAQKKAEKKKLLKIKKKELMLAQAQELIEKKPVALPEQHEEEETEVMYNKIDFETENSKKKFKRERPKTEKDPVKALNKIEELNKKVTELKESGNEEKAAAIMSKESWKKAILRADGIKVKDNVKLIKKTIKRKENKKTKSTTEWGKRKEATEKRVANAQKKRKENIMKKKKEKKQNKIKKSIKKGRVVI